MSSEDEEENDTNKRYIDSEREDEDY